MKRRWQLDHRRDPGIGLLAGGTWKQLIGVVRWRMRAAAQASDLTSPMVVSPVAARTRCDQRQAVGDAWPVITEVPPAAHRVGRRLYRQPKGPHPPCVYAPRWPTGRWWVQVTWKGETTYLGVVDSPEQGARLVAAFKQQMATEEAMTAQPMPVNQR